MNKLTKYLYLALVALILFDFVHSYDSDEEKNEFVKMVEKLRKHNEDKKLDANKVDEKLIECAKAHIGHSTWVKIYVKYAIFENVDPMDTIQYLMKESSSWMNVDGWHNCIYCIANGLGIYKN
ncbi:unnamed protein product [Brassicogethes aeneus]|uniref:Uncharacterized protein n=1 Tax=Brassicogethes aeneus TaxID=1431903 RepID=A0A9P0FNG8_BRAAE|nr:unnamed protein product [Brassicogethes aeneus]